ncbi:hypothetical protein M514_09634, partial [Trichuris suis]
LVHQSKWHSVRLNRRLTGIKDIRYRPPSDEGIGKRYDACQQYGSAMELQFGCRQAKAFTNDMTVPTLWECSGTPIRLPSGEGIGKRYDACQHYGSAMELQFGCHEVKALTNDMNIPTLWECNGTPIRLKQRSLEDIIVTFADQ